MFQLPLVGSSIEVALRLSDEPVRTDLPSLESADTNAVPSSARPTVSTHKRPTIENALAANDEIVHKNLQIRKSGHESAGQLGDGGPPYCRISVIHAKQAVGREESGNPCGVFAAPRRRVLLRKLAQMSSF